MRRSHSTPVKPLTHPTRFAPEPVAPAEDPSQQQRRTQKRQNLIQELVDTEDAYVKSLTDIDEYFLQPLLHSVDSSGAFSAPLLDRKAISEIFSNFSDVLTLNKEILRRLQDGAGTPTSEVEREFSQEAAFQAAAVAHDDPGNLLLPLCPFLRCYKMFIQNFSRSLERLLREERESDRWRGFLESRAKIGKGKGLGLSGMLLGIVQRIPRYRMLLSSIVELTMPDHRDFTDLAKACAIVTEGKTLMQPLLSQEV